MHIKTGSTKIGFSVKRDNETLNPLGAGENNSVPEYSRSPFSVRPTNHGRLVCLLVFSQTGYRLHLETHTDSRTTRIRWPIWEISTLNHLFRSLIKLTQSIVSGPPPQCWLPGACRPLRNGSSLPRLQCAVLHRSYSGNRTAYILTFFYFIQINSHIEFNLTGLTLHLGCSISLWWRDATCGCNRRLSFEPHLMVYNEILNKKNIV